MISFMMVGKSLRRVIGGGLTVLVLLAVPALGLAHLGSDLLASWQQGRDAEQAATAPWTFDAPTSTVARLDAGAKSSAAASRAGLPVDMAVLLEEWQSTNLFTELIAEAQENMGDLLATELRIDLFLFLTGQQQSLQLVLFQQLYLNSVISQEFLTQLGLISARLPLASPWQ
jgi:hypothetical protein